MANSFPLNEVEQHFKRVLQYAPNMLGNDVVNFSLDSFKKQGWTGNTFEPWRQRSSKAKRNKGRAILIDTGRLRRSIRVTNVSAGTVTIGTGVPYAKANNEGFRGTVNVKAHTRNKYSKEKVASGKLTSKGVARMKTVQRISATGNVKAHTRKVNIIKRKFLGLDSPYLQKQLQRRLQAELMKGLRTA